MAKKLPIEEKLVYYGWNLMTFGMVWMMKIVIKKAIIEAMRKDK